MRRDVLKLILQLFECYKWAEEPDYIFDEINRLGLQDAVLQALSSYLRKKDGKYFYSTYAFEAMMRIDANYTISNEPSLFDKEESHWSISHLIYRYGGPDNAIDKLILLLQSSASPEVRNIAAYALSRYDTERVILALEQAANNDNDTDVHGNRVSLSARRALAMMKEEPC
jgi:hypothetical protein